MAHIERRVRNGKVSYRARYRDPAGRERSKTFSRKVDAERWLTEVEHTKVRGGWTDPALGKVRFSDWLTAWWATTTNLRPTTRARDETLLRLYAIPRFGDMRLAAISQLEVRAWVAELSARGLAPATVTKAYQLLGKVMAAAVDAGYLAQTPCRKIPLPPIEREEMRFLTPAEIVTLAGAIRPIYRALVFTGAYGGLRIGELAGLRRRRVDPSGSSRFAIGSGGQRPRRLNSTDCASMTSGIQPSHSGSPRAPARRKWPLAPVTPRSASPSIAMATTIQRQTPSS